MNSISDSGPLAGVDPRQLRALLAVVTEGSFRDAADLLGYAQSAVSHQISALEKALGARLIDRRAGRREVTATDAGEVALSHARVLLAAYDALAEDFRARAVGEAGTVRVGVFQTAAAFLLAEPLGRFHRRYPDVELLLTEQLDPQELRNLLAAGRIDLAFDCDGEPDDAIDLLHLVDDPWVVITPRDGHFTQRTYLDPSDLAGRPMIAWNPSDARLEASLQAQGIEPDVIFRTNDNVALTRFVAAGLGDACVGSMFGTSLLDPTVMALPLRGRAMPRRISLATARGRPLPTAAQNLVSALVESLPA